MIPRDEREAVPHLGQMTAQQRERNMEGTKPMKFEHQPQNIGLPEHVYNSIAAIEGQLAETIANVEGSAQ